MLIKPTTHNLITTKTFIPHQPRTTRSPLTFSYPTRYQQHIQPTASMLFTRLLSLILRTAQWVFATIVLGLSAYFVYQRSRYHVGPLGRLIFALIWSSFSILFAVIWAIPTKHSITRYVSDFGKHISVYLRLE
jgi:hypothetical protein